MFHTLIDLMHTLYTYNQCTQQTDVEEEFERILQEKPSWGLSQPREWRSFMLFGKGRKCQHVDAEPSAWTLYSARSSNRGKTGRLKQRKNTKTFREKLQASEKAR